MSGIPPFGVAPSPWESRTTNDYVALSPKSPNWAIEFAPDGMTLDGTYGFHDGFISLQSDLTVDQPAGVIPPMVVFRSTVTLDSSPNAFGSGFLFWAVGTVKNNSSSTLTMGPFYTLGDQMRIEADTQAFTQYFGADILMQPAWGVVNSGTLTLGGFGVPHIGISITPSFGSGVTATEWNGIRIGTPTVNGTLTSNYGIRVLGQTTGTSNYGIAIGDASTNTLWINNDNNSTDVAGGAVFGSSKDTNLYRRGANELGTDDKLYVALELEVDGDLNHDGNNIGFFGTAPVAQATELTDELTGVTHTAPGTPDYAIAAPVDSGSGSAFGFSTADEFNTIMSVIANLQTRQDELETKLVAYGLLVDAD